jgi:translation initiation factor 2 alpha subunit (eIF-2alpha)
MELQEKNGRTRMNVSITAKGLAQWEVTSEYADPVEAERNLTDAINRVREVIKKNGLKEVGCE